MNIREISPIQKSQYQDIDLDRLIVYTMAFLNKYDIRLTLENIIVGAYKLFPGKFSLSGFPEYPDATRVEKSLWRCKGRNKQWITGKTPHGYSLNRKSYHIVQDVENHFSNSLERLDVNKGKARTRRGEIIIREIEKSNAFEKYKNDEIAKISESEFCFLLQTTLDSPKNILNENLSALKLFAEEFNRSDILIFLNKLEKKFEYFLK